MINITKLYRNLQTISTITTDTHITYNLSIIAINITNI